MLSKNLTELFFYKSIPLIAIFLVLGFHFYFFNYSYLPLTEGWFNVFSKLVNDGKVVYKDFNFYLTPLYLHFISLFTSFFGDNIFTLRNLGFFINVGLCYLIFLNLKNFYSLSTTFLIAIASYFYYQSGVAFISYDFTQVLTLLSLFTLFSLLNLNKSLFIKNNSYLLWSSLVGFFSTATFMTKQSNGSFIFLSTFISFAILLFFIKKINLNKNIFKVVLCYFCGILLILLPYFIYFLINSAFIDFINSIYFNAISSKGSLDKILLSWISNTYLNKVLWLQFFEISKIIIYILLISFALKILTFKYKFLNFSEYFFIFIYSIVFIIALNLIYFKYILSINIINELSFYNNYIIPSCLVFNLFAILYTFFYSFVFKKYDYLLHLCFFIFTFGLLFGNGTSAGLSEISVFLILGFILGFIYTKIKIIGPILIIILSIIFVLFFSFLKYQQPYNWWGVIQGDVRLSSYQSEINLFKNINLNLDTKKSYDQILINIEKYSDKNFYSFPSIPIIYRISNKYPDSKTIVQWYDFLPDSEARLEALRLNDNRPDIIFYLSMPDLVIDTHEILFRNNTQIGQRDIINLISSLIENKVYKEVDKIKLDDNLFIKILEKK